MNEIEKLRIYDDIDMGWDWVRYIWTKVAIL